MHLAETVLNFGKSEPTKKVYDDRWLSEFTIYVMILYTSKVCRFNTLNCHAEQNYQRDISM